MLESPHILWVTERFPPLSGGMAESADRLVSGLRKRSYQVDVVHLVQSDGPVTCRGRPRDNGVDLVVTWRDSVGDAVQRAWLEVLLGHQVEEFDLLVGFGCNLPGHVAATWAAWLGLPSVVLVRGNDLDRDWFEVRRHSLVESALGRATVVGAVTQEKVDKVRALFPGKVARWTPNGLDEAFWRLLPADREQAQDLRRGLAAGGRRVVAVVGDLKYKKRIPFWLEAVRDRGLKDRIALLVVGRMDRELNQILEDPALAPRVHHLSFRTRERLPALYHACDFVAVPSLYDGFPNVLLEAMACGVVPICSRAAAMGEVLLDGETGFLFEPEDREGAGEATWRALELDDPALERMKKRVQTMVRRRFSRADELERLEKLLRIAMETRHDEHHRREGHASS